MRQAARPTPCIDCNRFMKFDKLLDFAEQHGLYYVVTGHYARIEQDEQTGRWLLKRAWTRARTRAMCCTR